LKKASVVSRDVNKNTLTQAQCSIAKVKPTANPIFLTLMTSMMPSFLIGVLFTISMAMSAAHHHKVTGKHREDDEKHGIVPA